MLDAMKKNKQGHIFKIDFEKPYDKVDWHFLRVILKRMCSGEK